MPRKAKTSTSAPPVPSSEPAPSVPSAPGDDRVWNREQIEREIMRRKALDPWNHFRPSPTQGRFLASPCRFRLITGGNRSGKSQTALFDMALCARGKHPNRPWYGPIEIIAFGVSRTQVANVMQEKLLRKSQLPGLPGQLPMIPEWEINWRESGSLKLAGVRVYYKVTLLNGSTIHFSWSDDEDAAMRLQGQKADYIYFDENAGNRKLVVEAMARLKDAISDPLRPWGGCLTWGATGTMINDGFETFRNKCIDPDEPEYAYFQVMPGENPAISKEADDIFEEFLTEEERKIRVTGEKTALDDVLIYGDHWRDERHVIRGPYTIRPEDNIWLAYDPGMDHPTGMLLAVVSPANPAQLRVVQFFNVRKTTMDQDARLLQQWLAGRRMAGVVYDTVMKNTDKRGSSTLALMKEAFEKLNISPMMGYFRAAKNHPQGIERVRRYLDPNPYDHEAVPLLICNMTDTNGVGRFRYQMTSYRGNEEKQFRGPGGVVKKDDEGPDCIRYLCQRRVRYIDKMACGAATMQVVDPDMPPELLVAPADIQLTPYQRQLQLSRKAAELRNRRSAKSRRIRQSRVA